MDTVPERADGMHLPRRSLRTRLTLWAAVGQGLLLLLLVALFYLEGRSLVRQQGLAQMTHLAEQTALTLGNTLESAQITAHILAAPFGRQPFDAAQAGALLQSALDSDPNIEAATVVVDPGALPELDAGFTCQAVMGDSRVRRRCGDGSNLDFLKQSPNLAYKQARGPWWSPPHEGWLANGRRFTSYNVPLRQPGAETPIGVVRVDVGVEHLLDDLSAVPRQEDIRVSLLTPDNQVLLTTAPWVAPGVGLATLVAQRPDMAPLRAALDGSGPRAFAHGSVGGRRVLTTAVPLQQPGWHLLLSVNQRVLLEGIDRLAWQAIGLGVLGMLLWWWLVRVQARRLLQPLETLTAAAGRFAAGHFDQPVPRGGNDEVGQLSVAFERARRSIGQQMATIADLAGRRVRDESELRIAQGIQQQLLSSLPSVDEAGFRVSSHALLVPARQVGGDFHHVLVLPPTAESPSPRLCFVIGDVSGKGVPAALFMTRMLTLLEVTMRVHARPDAVLAEVARSALERNEACMFATVLCGVVEVATGRFELASAGHDAPLLRQRSGKVAPVPMRAGPALGLDASATYPVVRGVLADGEYLLAYTDGITEASAPGGLWFGSEGLQAAVAATAAPARVGQAVLDAVTQCTGKAQPQDDLSLLVLARRRLWPPLHLHGPARQRDFCVLLVQLEEGLQRMGLARDDILRAQLMVEEIGGNVVRHGQGRGSGLRHLQVVVDSADTGLVVEIIDDGPPFDPTAAMKPLPAGLREDEGGLGLGLVQALADDLRYRRQEGRNHLNIQLRDGPLPLMPGVPLPARVSTHG